VLIHGAGGGVESVAAQLARAAGTHVIATGRGWSRELVAKLGAERFEDLDQERFEAVAEEVDLVVDLADGDKAFEAKRGGGVPGKVVLRISDQ